MATRRTIATGTTRTARKITGAALNTGRTRPTMTAVAALATDPAATTGRISPGDTAAAAGGTTDTAITTRTARGAVTGIPTRFTTSPRRSPGGAHVAVTAGATGATSTRHTTGTAITINPVCGVA